MLYEQHFGRLRAHRHTSYAALGFILLITGVLLSAVSWSALAASPPPNPQSGSIGLSGTVNGPPPGTAAVILTPSNGSQTSSIPITISGTCPSNTFVSIEKNNVFAGATPCESNGTFSLQVDLFVGANILVARVADALGQYGPDSAPVNVFYNAPASAEGSSGNGAQQLFLNTNQTVAGTEPSQSLARAISIGGGVGPFAVSWSWGDNTTTLMSSATDGPLSASHTYKIAGTYTVIIRATDSTGASAYLQVVTVVNGPSAAYGSTNGSGSGSLPGQLISAWPVYGSMGIIVFSFWLGERREVRKLRRQGRLLATGIH